jgi:hypothetical protein
VLQIQLHALKTDDQRWFVDPQFAQVVTGSHLPEFDNQQGRTTKQMDKNPDWTYSMSPAV